MWSYIYQPDFCGYVHFYDLLKELFHVAQDSPKFDGFHFCSALVNEISFKFYGHTHTRTHTLTDRKQGALMKWDWPLLDKSAHLLTNCSHVFHKILGRSSHIPHTTRQHTSWFSSDILHHWRFCVLASFALMINNFLEINVICDTVMVVGLKLIPPHPQKAILNQDCT